MSANQFGKYFVLMSFGESHGPAVGGVIDGCPAGVAFSTQAVQAQLNRRRPGQSKIVTSRNETDQVEILSGVLGEKTLGTPIAFIIRNVDQQSKAYDSISTQPRPGHADDVWKNKFSVWDHRGGGRSSGRETAVRVAAGAIAQQVLATAWPQFRSICFSSQIGPVQISSESRAQTLNEALKIDDFSSRLPGPQNAEVEALLLKGKESGESFGGTVEVHLKGVPAGLGEPIFYKLKSQLAAAMMSIGASVALEFGLGLNFSQQSGTATHANGEQRIYGGIRGGISTGESIEFKVHFKPTSSILDVAKKGRHDPCIVPRAVPVVEAMTYLVLADLFLAQRLNNI